MTVLPAVFPIKMQILRIDFDAGGHLAGPRRCMGGRAVHGISSHDSPASLAAKFSRAATVGPVDDSALGRIIQRQ